MLNLRPFMASKTICTNGKPIASAVDRDYEFRHMTGTTRVSVHLTEDFV